MRHPTDGALRAYVDGELSPAARSAVERHTGACAACRDRLDGVRTDAAWADRLLRAAAGGETAAGGAAADGAAAPAHVWNDLSHVWHQPPLDRVALAPSAPPGHAGPGAGRRRARVAAGLAAVVVLGALALPPVRAAAAGLLSVFRVQRLQAVTVSPGELAQIRRLLHAGPGGVRIAGLATIRVSPSRVHRIATTLSHASSLAGFRLAVPEPAPAGTRLQSVSVRPPQRFAFRLHAAAADRLLASLGSRQSLPPSLDGATIRLYVPAAAFLVYARAGGGTPLRVIEAPGPELKVPQGVDAVQVRNFLLHLPFVPAGLRAQLAAVSDWRQTALVPVPAGRAQSVTVDGRPGVFVRPRSATGASPAGGSLVWISRGLIRVVSGMPTLASAEAVAAAMH